MKISIERITPVPDKPQKSVQAEALEWFDGEHKMIAQYCELRAILDSSEGKDYEMVVDPVTDSVTIRKKTIEDETGPALFFSGQATQLEERYQWVKKSDQEKGTPVSGTGRWQ